MRQIPALIRSLALASLLLAGSAFGQAARTWVSGVGDDGNPCTRTAPGLTFAGALVKTATNGEIDVLDPGEFEPVTIAQSVTIDGGAAFAGLMVTGTPAIIINGSGATPIVVTLRNLSLNGFDSGSIGVQVLGPAVVHIENCKIFGFTGHGVDFEPAAAAGSALYIQDSHIYNCGGDAAFLKPATASIIAIQHSRFDDCAVGVHGDANSITSIRGSMAAGNTGAGFETTPKATMNIATSETSLNGVGISSAGTVFISDVTVENNIGAGLTHTARTKAAAEGLIKSFHNNPVGDDGTKTEGLPTSSVPLR